MKTEEFFSDLKQIHNKLSSPDPENRVAFKKKKMCSVYLNKIAGHCANGKRDKE